MSDSEKPDPPDRPGQRRKTRTWWHPLLASVVNYLSEGIFEVRDEMAVGQLPLRVDFGMVWNVEQDLPLIVPAITAGLEQEVAALGLSFRQEEPVVIHVGGEVFPVWVIETGIAGKRYPLLALFSPLILQDPSATDTAISTSPGGVCDAAHGCGIHGRSVRRTEGVGHRSYPR